VDARAILNVVKRKISKEPLQNDDYTCLKLHINRLYCKLTIKSNYTTIWFI